MRVCVCSINNNKYDLKFYNIHMIKITCLLNAFDSILILPKNIFVYVYSYKYVNLFM